MKANTAKTANEMTMYYDLPRDKYAIDILVYVNEVGKKSVQWKEKHTYAAELWTKEEILDDLRKVLRDFNANLRKYEKPREFAKILKTNPDDKDDFDVWFDSEKDGSFIN